MRTSTFLAPLFLAATSLAQGVEVGIAPSATAPEGCEDTVSGNFTIGTLKLTVHPHKRETAQQAADGVLLCTLQDGILIDQYARVGSVVANHQFQFDGPPQAGAIYTGGFSVCANDSLAIGGTARWWQCSSGPFYNLYDAYIGSQCEEIRIQVGFPEDSAAASSSSSAPASSSATSSEFSGTVSTLSATQSGLTSHSTSFTVSSTGSSATASSTGASATGSASSTSAGPAPPAQTGAASSLSIARGATLGAVMVIVGAVLSL